MSPIPTREGAAKRAALAGIALLLFSLPALASEQLRFNPGVELGGGADDNLMVGTGGDRVGRGALLLDLKAWDHLWEVSFDGSAIVYGFQEHQEIVPVGESTLHTRARIDRMNEVRSRIIVRGSDDPLGLAEVGLLNAKIPGTILGHRGWAEWQHDFDERWSIDTALNFAGVTPLDAAAQGDYGEGVGLGLRPRFMVTRDTAVEALVGERTFLASGVLGEALDLLPGLRYRIARRFFAEAEAGPSVYHDSQGYLPMPVGHGSVGYDDRNWGWQVNVGQDLAVPSGRTGVLTMELAEAIARYGDEAWELRARGGGYRTLDDPRSTTWIPAYGIELDAYRRIAAFAWVGISALRFDQVATQTANAVARDAVYAQVEFTVGRP